MHGAAMTTPSDTTTWVLVADEAIARLLEQPGAAQGGLVPVEELTDPGAHARHGELASDALGRRAGADLRSGGNATASSGEDDALDQRAERFARRVADRLAEARQQGRYDALRIAAAPRFLGRLRKALPKQVADCVCETQDKDLVHLDAAALTLRFPPLSRAPRAF